MCVEVPTGFTFAVLRPRAHQCCLIYKYDALTDALQKKMSIEQEELFIVPQVNPEAFWPFARARVEPKVETSSLRELPTPRVLKLVSVP